MARDFSVLGLCWSRQLGFTQANPPPRSVLWVSGLWLRHNGTDPMIVYNMELKQIEQYVLFTLSRVGVFTAFICSQTPTVNDVRDVTLARNTCQGLVALVSYENQVCYLLGPRL
jgi:hypothetical protein